MSDAPEGIVLRRHRDLDGRRHQVWARRAVLGLILLVPLLGLTNLFGQKSTSVEAAGPAASLTLDAPTKVRGGLLFEAHFTIRAKTDVKNAVLLLHPDWLKGMTLNTLAPSPTEETSDNGSLRLVFGPIPAGQRFDVMLQYQVNPTSIGKRKQWVDLLDGQTRIATIQRGLFIYP
jgi:hypothetical protein